MKYVLLAWATPLALFWGWFFLSANDINFGSIYLSRALHDLVFQLYGQMLGIDGATIPWLVAKACILDTGLLLGIWAFRRRALLRAWLAAQRQRYFPGDFTAGREADRAHLEG
jgi:hypothetical protein